MEWVLAWNRPYMRAESRWLATVVGLAVASLLVLAIPSVTARYLGGMLLLCLVPGLALMGVLSRSVLTLSWLEGLPLGGRVFGLSVP